MSKRELGKLASVVDVDAPRAKRRKEAAVPQEEKKPETDMDVDVTGEMKREQEDPAKLEQVKEQGLKLWQTLRDAVDKECVTDLTCACSPA
jgi:chromatin structure-remodeling complex subunit RSC4